MNQCKQYIDLGKYILQNGQPVQDRTGTGTISIFRPETMKFDLSKSFPLVTAKKMPFKGIVRELEWFINGDDQIEKLHPSIRSWWQPWANETGKLKSMYHHQLMTLEQLPDVIEQLRFDPHSRRHVLTTWNASTVKEQPLACCHGTVIQFYVRGNYLDMSTYQRSADYFLGLPINIASYSLLQLAIAKITKLRPGTLYYDLGDAHIYQNHIQQVKEMVSRELLPDPTVKVSDDFQHIRHFSLDKFELINYRSHGELKGKMSV